MADMDGIETSAEYYSPDFTHGGRFSELSLGDENGNYITDFTHRSVKIVVDHTPVETVGESHFIAGFLYALAQGLL